MSYQALYRVWRPQRFDEIVGQQVITTTLKNALITNQTSHAYLFTGPRGTGKTSAAKIFAKAINCHYLKDGEPCNECDTCKAITNGQLNDVIEIDAASNNGVEEIRDIRDKAKYAPTQADYKVYIIDEVHMLSTGAFNALLKTLEEPPANVVFILATTEPHKIPLTIISRTQRFDFRRISADESFGRMKFILDQKQVEYDEQALWVIARAAEGGMRDALSILDQALSFSDNQITVDNALLVTGSVTKQLLHQYLQQVSDHQSGPALETMQSILGAGKDGQRFIEDLISFVRDLLLYQEAPELINVESTGLSEQDYKALAEKIDSSVLYQMIDQLNEIQQEMRFTTHPDVYLEVLTVKLSQLNASSTGATAISDPSPQIEQLQDTVSKLQQEITQLQQQPVKQPQAAESKPTPKRTSSSQTIKVNLSKVYPILEAATKDDLVKLRDIWGDMLNMLSVPQRALLHVSKPVAASPQGVIVAFDYGFLYQKAVTDDMLETDMENDLKKLIGEARSIVYVPNDQWPTIRQNFISQHDLNRPSTSTKEVEDEDDATDIDEPKEETNDSNDDKMVTEAQKLFGNDIVEVKND
ncbi:DNA polymerase III subunit gamma/tau [Paucilactobacillus hokkaidonensis JCM 18461]|uniref:DNA-directed DNA polymerase n=2 Tax=Paucilactobacillus hokkaidonensis TaxID=1193095 RepID=A0A0A1GW76_9LACO|nr:DNA polymerase III subunit gamma/tau [Paucilactobacillus hokkaidonensis]BAP86240.1 DNA polymerase III subunit gamma/tau [Paucilactobacillus hokkaidonensis JCM 18461]